MQQFSLAYLPFVIYKVEPIICLLLTDSNNDNYKDFFLNNVVYVMLWLLACIYLNVYKVFSLFTTLWANSADNK